MPPRTEHGLTMLVDGSSLIYRAWFAVPDTVRAPDGTPVNGVYGFLNSLARLVADHRPSFLACTTDEDWRPEWRVELIDSYKTHRLAEDEAQEDPVAPQIELTVDLLGMAGIAVVGCPEYEAEDVIGALLPRSPGKVAIVSGDRDLFQLVRDPDVIVLYPQRGVTEMTRVDETYIARKYGIPGRAYADFAILRGDPSDGLPGVPGIGDKSASALIAKHGTVEKVLEAAERDATGPLGKVKANRDYVERAMKVVRITADAPIGDVDTALGTRKPDPEFVEHAASLGLRAPAERLLAAIEG